MTNALYDAVDELLNCVADPGYRVDSFTFQPLREVRRRMLPGNPFDCTDPTCGGFMATPMPDGSLTCTVWNCHEVMETDESMERADRLNGFNCNGHTGSADDCTGCNRCRPIHFGDTL